MRCKFRVTKITRSMGGKSVPDLENPGRSKWVPMEAWTVEMRPVSGNGDPSHENTKFWNASPSGEFKVETVNKEAVEDLVLDGEYYFDITPAFSTIAPPAPAAGS